MIISIDAENALDKIQYPFFFFSFRKQQTFTILWFLWARNQGVPIPIFNKNSQKWEWVFPQPNKKHL